MDLQKMRQEHEEWCHTQRLQQIEQFDRIRKMMIPVKENRDRIFILCMFLDGVEMTDESKRVTLCELMTKCDEKYGINATYKDLSAEDKELVPNYIL